MPDEAVLKTIDLSNGYRAAVIDDTRHYFGGYYDVRLRVQVDIPLSVDWFTSAEAYRDACRRLGAEVRFSRTLSRMAVPTGSTEQARAELLQNFEAHLLPYLLRHDFPSRFALSEYARAAKPALRYRDRS